MTSTEQAPDWQPVSAIVATRSRPELLRTAVRSILAQDYPGDIEVVVVFDQSPVDESLPGEFADAPQAGARRVVVRANERTPGLAGARNSGVLASTGALLAFCDDDDAWVPAKLTTQVSAMVTQQADLSVSGIEIIIGDRTHVRVPSQQDVTLEELARRRVMEAHPSTVVVSRSAFDQIGLVDEQIPGGYAEDYDWMLRAVADQRVAVISEPLVRVLWHPGSFFSTRWRTIIEALDYTVAKHDSLRNSPQGLARIYGQKAFAFAALGERAEALRWAWRSLRLSPKEKRSYLALATSLRLVSAARLVQLANARGKGI
jgi:glycosyltransferase involved in cell wall biosynthesis